MAAPEQYSDLYQDQLSLDTPVTQLNFSTRSLNSLMRYQITTVGELLSLDIDLFAGYRGVGAKSVKEIASFIAHNKDLIQAEASHLVSTADDKNYAAMDPQRKKAFDEYVKTYDFKISTSNLPVRVKNALESLGTQTFSELRCLDINSLKRNPNIGKTSINAIREFIDSINKGFMNEFDECYVDGHFTSAYIRKMVLLLYRDIPFKGFSYRRIKERLPEDFSDNEVKEAIGKLIASNELEYVDYRCYKVYPSFFTYLNTYIEEVEDKKNALLIADKYKGRTLQQVADKAGVTRERVRQLIGKEIRKVKDSYFLKTGNEVFDEDYYQYLWENYYINKDVGLNYLAISEATYNYLKETYSKGETSLENSVNDENIDTAIKLKIITYLNKDKIEIDGQLIDKKRNPIEKYVISEYCKDETHIDDFFKIYNRVLKDNGIPYDSSIYIDSDMERARAARITDCDYVLWKEGRSFRYYNINANDYTDLLDTLNLPAYKNTEISTLKFVEQYPELMTAYDIRDQYELHNLLRKIVDPSTCNEIDFSRTPVLKFGEFDRDAAIYELICAFSPIRQSDLVEYIHDEYGYSELFITMNMLPHFSRYVHKNTYTVDFQRIPESRTEQLKQKLTEDFYYIKDIRKKYTDVFEGADQNDINPYSLKELGFVVYLNYVVQHFDSAFDYFAYELTKNDVYDISAIREKYGNLRAYRATFTELKRALEIFEFEPNQFITINRLKKLNITKEDLREYIDEVYDAASDYNFFTISSLRNEGYSFALDDLGLNEYFYWNLLAQDERFNARKVSDSAIISANNSYIDVSIKLFILRVLDDYDSIEPEDLVESILNEYGLKLERQDVLDAVSDTDKYYDRIMNKVYRNKMLYYDEFED